MDFPGTKKYVGKVAERYQLYRGIFPAKKG